MDLKTFISETLVGIIEGVAEAQKRIGEEHGTAAISLLDRPEDQASWRNPDVKEVVFDVAITSAQEETRETGGKAGFKVYVINASIDGKDAETSKASSVSRVQFTVPVHLPVMHSSNKSEARQISQEAVRRSLERPRRNIV